MDNTNTSPPFFGPQRPLYPHLLQALRVTGATVPGPTGGTSAGLGTGTVPPASLYIAATQQLRTDTLAPRDREPCLVTDLNNEGLSAGYYLGRLAGTFNGLPVYETTARNQVSSGSLSTITTQTTGFFPSSTPTGSDVPLVWDELIQTLFLYSLRDNRWRGIAGSTTVNQTFGRTTVATAPPVGRLVLPRLTATAHPSWTPLEGGEVLCGYGQRFIYQGHPGAGGGGWAGTGGDWEIYPPYAGDPTTRSNQQLPLIVDANGRLAPVAPNTTTTRMPLWGIGDATNPLAPVFQPALVNDLTNLPASVLAGRGSGGGTGVGQHITLGPNLTMTGTVLDSVASGTGTVTSVGISASGTGLNVSNSPVTGTGTITIGGVLVVGSGGTGLGSLAAYAVLCGGTTAMGALQQVSGLGTSGFVLTSNGTGALPTWQAKTTGTVTSVGLAPPSAGIAVSNSPVTSSGTLTINLVNDLAAVEGLGGTGLAARTGTDAWALRTLTGTTNRLTVTNGDGVSGNPTLDVSTLYAGQATIVTLGVVVTGTWQATLVAPQYGGTGVNGVAAANGTFLIGNGSGYTLATLTAGSNITITNAAGSVTIAASGSSSGGTVTGTGVPGRAAKWLTSSSIGDSCITDSTTDVSIAPTAIGSSAAAFTHELDALCSTTPVAGFGSITSWRLADASSGSTPQQAYEREVSWGTATHASRAARTFERLYDFAGAYTYFSAEVASSALKIVWFGGTRVTQRTGDLATALGASGYNLVLSATVAATDLTGTVPVVRMPAGTGDVTWAAGTTTTVLATVNSNVGTFGSATVSAVITANAKGLVTAVTTSTITPAWGSITGTPTTVAGYGITDGTTGSGTATLVAVWTGTRTLGTGSITDNASSVVIAPVSTGAAGATYFGFNFDGYLTGASPVPATGFGSISSWRLVSSTNTLRQAYEREVSWQTATDATRSAETFERLYDTSAHEFFRVKLVSGALKLAWFGSTEVAQQTGSLVTALSNYGLVTSGTVAATDLTGTILAARMPAGTGDVTWSTGSTATTLATVNANVGSFGDATHTVTVTVNAKGLVTAISQVSIAGLAASVITSGTFALARLASGTGTANNCILGNQTVGNVPARAARVSALGTAPSIPNGGSWTAVRFTGASASGDYDTDAFHNVLTNPSRVTFPSGLGGKYVITGKVEWDGTNKFSPSGARSIGILYDGWLLLTRVDKTSDSVTPSSFMVVATEAVVNATDYVELVVWQSSGGSLSIISANLCVEWVGP